MPQALSRRAASASHHPVQEVDVLVLGAGAAGMMAALEAGRRGCRVVLVDHAKPPGEKIRISGGGRCNFTNREAPIERFISANPKFAISALKRFPPLDFIARVNAAGIAWHEKTLGQLFCDGPAQQIIDMFLGDLESAGVRLELGCCVKAVGRDGGYVVVTDQGSFRSESLIVATGGKSIPKIGATAFGYRLAEQFGLPVTETRPGLVPLSFGAAELAEIIPLAGVSVASRVSCGPAGFDEALLFTHRGLSGPAILQISSYWREGDEVVVDLARGQDISRALRDLRGAAGRQAVHHVLARFLPEKVALLATARAAVAGRLADQSKVAIDQMSEAVHRWHLRPSGSEGYRTAEVTLGGVDTAALDARTMAARDVPGLYFVGEVVDVTGWLGGYNFQWAWSSGWAAGQVA